MTRALILIAGWMERAFEEWIATLRRPLAAEVAALRERNERLRAENELLRLRLERVDPHRRPHYAPWERLAILWHRSRHGLSVEATARAFVVCVNTVTNWLAAVEAGVRRLVSTREPMNRLGDLVRELAVRLKAEWPRWGSRRIAGQFARLGIQASRSSVRRMLRRGPPRPRNLARARQGPLIAKHPGQIFLIDFTWVRSFFRSVVVGAVVDAFSRRVLAVRVCRQEPNAAFACRLLREAIGRHGKPRWVVTDRGVQFTSLAFAACLRRRKIRHRFGAIGRKGSIAIVERFWKSMKAEVAVEWLPWFPLRAIERKLSGYTTWFNSERPHFGLGYRTPDDVWFGRTLPRSRRLRRGVLTVDCVAGDASLPILRLRAAG